MAHTNSIATTPLRLESQDSVRSAVGRINAKHVETWTLKNRVAGKTVTTRVGVSREEAEKWVTEIVYRECDYDRALDAIAAAVGLHRSSIHVTAWHIVRAEPNVDADVIGKTFGENAAYYRRLAAKAFAKGGKVNGLTGEQAVWHALDAECRAAFVPQEIRRFQRGEIRA